MNDYDQTTNPFVSPESTSAADDPLAAALTDLPPRSYRLFAAMIDFLLVDVPAAYVVSYLMPSVEQLFFSFDEAGNPIESPFSDWPMFGTSVLITLCCYLLIEGYLLATRGQTLGKAAFEMKIVRRNGQRAGFARLVLIRYLPLMIFYHAQLLSISIAPIGIGLFIRLLFSSILLDPLLIFTKEKRCGHDYLAGTIVVKAS